MRELRCAIRTAAQKRQTHVLAVVRGRGVVEKQRRETIGIYQGREEHTRKPRAFDRGK